MRNGASSQSTPAVKRIPLHKRLLCFREPLWLGGGTYDRHIQWQRSSIGSAQNGKMAS